MSGQFLPTEFIEKYNRLMGHEAESFFTSLKEDRTYGVRKNDLKIDEKEFVTRWEQEFGVTPEPIPWVPGGYYYDGNTVSPGRSPMYMEGLYYIQDPSAMLPGAVAAPKPGMRVLDLCSAPGGKAIQMAAYMQGQGTLYCNDISATRIKALIRNLEQFGVRNAIVLNEDPTKLVDRFRDYFDVIVADVPCSGEGMFRKDKNSIAEWDGHGADRLAPIQYSILCNAAQMIRGGGTIIYSTCTYAPEEDELIIEKFLREYPDFYLEKIPCGYGQAPGRTDWTEFGTDMSGSVRMWPHLLKGEGHYTAKLVRKGDDYREPVKANIKVDKDVLQAFTKFAKETLSISFDNHCLYTVGNGLYAMTEKPANLDRLKVCKFGWYLGCLDHGKFVPSQSLVCALKVEELAPNRVISLTSDSPDAHSYLKCETPSFDTDVKGYLAVAIDGIPVGWVKSSGSVIKNMYPSGWRMC